MDILLMNKAENCKSIGLNRATTIGLKRYQNLGMEISAGISCTPLFRLDLSTQGLKLKELFLLNWQDFPLPNRGILRSEQR
ncbi:hypothetical protein A4A49_31478 [Nicotiana attenuata]|uniref:Uncharacterized protein n=1 Tax=Nicotiana attenuata TaxID=49451 RepID=A0A1J6HSU2_NICAT|nr:hypothetical protein A4A49_31478 [Nicotiana attenuata]